MTWVTWDVLCAGTISGWPSEFTSVSFANLVIIAGAIELLYSCPPSVASSPYIFPEKSPIITSFIPSLETSSTCSRAHTDDPGVV